MVRCPLPLARPWKFFTGDFIWKSAFFAVFQQILFKNGRICGFHWTFKSQKCFSFRGRTPWPPDQKLCPWIPLGAPPPDPLIGSRSARSPWSPLCQILNTPLYGSDDPYSLTGLKAHSYRMIWQCYPCDPYIASGSIGSVFPFLPALFGLTCMSRGLSDRWRWTNETVLVYEPTGLARTHSTCLPRSSLPRAIASC